MSGLFGSSTIKGNRITEFADQTSTVGIPIPFGYGTYLTDGNVIWIADVVTHVTKKKQGKGGVKTEEYTYTRSYAIGFCQGPIYGYLTLTRNGKIVFTTDPNAKVEDRAFAAKWATNATLYYGTREQMPDSTIEAKEGAGQISAFRDLAYIVVENDDVTDGAGAVPSYQAVVIATPPEVYMSSRVYPIYDLDEANSSGTGIGGFVWNPPSDFVTAIGTPSNGTLHTLVRTYASGPDAATASGEPSDGTIKTVVKPYSNGLPDNVTASGEPVGGQMFRQLFQYDITFESVTATGTPLGGTKE